MSQRYSARANHFAAFGSWAKRLPVEGALLTNRLIE
jgi:hypothetical protein